MIKQIAIDVDGTITFKDKHIDCEAVRAIDYAREKGLKIILASGIPIQGLRPLSAFLGAESYYVGENGGVIFDGKEIEQLADPSEAKKCFELLKEKYPQVDIFSKADIRFSEVCIKNNIEPEKIEEVVKDCDLKVVPTGFAIHLMNPETSKGNGLKVLAEKVGFKIEETAGIGDSQNDIEMIKDVGFGIALANAHPALKEVADYVTKEKYGKGVREAVEKILETKV